MLVKDLGAGEPMWPRELVQDPTSVSKRAAITSVWLDQTNFHEMFTMLDKSKG